jgi:hypothetical protein
MKSRKKKGWRRNGEAWAEDSRRLLCFLVIVFYGQVWEGWCLSKRRVQMTWGWE